MNRTQRYKDFAFLTEVVEDMREVYQRVHKLAIIFDIEHDDTTPMSVLLVKATDFLMAEIQKYVDEYADDPLQPGEESEIDNLRHAMEQIRNHA